MSHGGPQSESMSYGSQRRKKIVLYRLQASWLLKAQQLTVYPPGSHKPSLEAELACMITNLQIPVEMINPKNQPLREIVNIKYSTCY